MSDYAVLWSVSSGLRRLIWEECEGEIARNASFSQFIDNEAQIEFLNPTETRERKGAYRVSLWLYQIVENEHVKNRYPLVNVDGKTTRLPPLALNLYYLITPFCTTSDANHILLGKMMQVLYNNANVLLNTEPGVYEELSIVLCRLSLEELTRIWDALKEPYRLSVAYQVRVSRIDSSRIVSSSRVLTAEGHHGQVPTSLTASEAARAARFG